MVKTRPRTMLAVARHGPPTNEIRSRTRYFHLYIACLVTDICLRICSCERPIREASLCLYVYVSVCVCNSVCHESIRFAGRQCWSLRNLALPPEPQKHSDMQIYHTRTLRIQKSQRKMQPVTDTVTSNQKKNQVPACRDLIPFLLQARMAWCFRKIIHI